MNRIDNFGKRLSSCASKSFFALLLATLVYATGAAGNNHACAANSTHKVTDVTGTVTRVELGNVDLQAYSKYNEDIQAISKNLLPISSISGNESSSPKEMDKDVYNKRAVRFLAKASPGSTISIRIQPESKLENYVATSLFLNRPYKIEGSQFDLRVKSQGGLLSQGLKNVKTRSYIVPQGADFIYVCWFHDYGEPNRPYWAGTVSYKDALKVEYYIFTSDEAFKKAYKIWTGKTLSGPVDSPSSPEDDWDIISMISMICIGLFGGGAIIIIIKKLLDKRGVDGKPSGTAPQYPQYPQEPESFVYTDPATGAQTLYERDPNTGEWFDPTTGAITDMSKLEEYTRQRAADRRWMDGQMDNLRNRNTATDRAWNQQDAAMNAEMQKNFDEIDRQGARDKAAIRSGTYGMSEAQRKESQRKWQSLLESQQNAAHRVEKIWDAGTKVAEGVQKAADIGMDIAATAAKTVDGGVVSGRIKDAYSMAKNMAGSTADAVARGKNVWAGIGKGFADGLVDIAQNNANGVYKTLSYVGGDAFKGGLNAAWEGEDIAIGAFKGSLKGTMKLGIDKVGDKIRSGITKPEDSLRNAFDHAREIRTVYSKGISQKSVDALQKMNIDKHLANLEKADYQNWANDITNALSSNLLPDAIFGG